MGFHFEYAHYCCNDNEDFKFDQNSQILFVFVLIKTLSFDFDESLMNYLIVISVRNESIFAIFYNWENLWVLCYLFVQRDIVISATL